MCGDGETEIQLKYQGHYYIIVLIYNYKSQYTQKKVNKQLYSFSSQIKMKDKITSFFIKTGFFSWEEVVKLWSIDGTCM